MADSSTADKFTKPESRHDFQIAIVCALGLEADMVRSFLDIEWSLDRLGLKRAPEDHNTYTIGVMGQHKLVLVHMPSMGSSYASHVAIDLKRSFPRTEIVFVVGICGVTPRNSATQEEIILGDCIISTAAVKYDFGRQYPEKFIRKRDFEDSLPRPGPAVRGFLAKLRSSHTFTPLQERLCSHLKSMQQKNPSASYPGVHRDRLFQPGYSHLHRDSKQCASCIVGTQICNNDCDAIGCDENSLVKRMRITAAEASAIDPMPRIHFGRYGSADTVMKSAIHRDELAEEDKILAFEMEAVGFWENFPTMIIKSACDYADSHKSKEWQLYAAATAAAGLRAILEEWRASDRHFDIENGWQPLTQTSVRLIHGTNAVPQDTGYTRDQAQKIWDQLRKAEELIIAEERGKLLDWISPIKYGIRHDKAFAKVQAGTCMWFLESKKFLKWMENSGETLFCYGPPGTGKTILTSIAINHLVEKTSNKGLAYIYGYYRNQDIQQNTLLLSLILKQLISQLPVIPEALHEEFRNSRSSGKSLTEASITMYLGEIRHHFDKVFILVDALDEFDNDRLQRDEFLTLLKGLQERHSFNLFFTARSIEAITCQFSSSQSLMVLANGDDIRAYLKGEISSWPRSRTQLDGNIAYGHNGCNCIETMAQPKSEMQQIATEKMCQDAITSIPLGELHITPQYMQISDEVIDASVSLDRRVLEHSQAAQEMLQSGSHRLKTKARESFLYVPTNQHEKSQMKEALLHAIDGTTTTIEKLSAPCTQKNIQITTNLDFVNQELVAFVQTIIVSSVALIADGSFLLANLHIGLLKQRRNIKGILAELKRILADPRGADESFTRAYDDAYEQYMERIRQQPQRFREMAQKTFAWMVCSADQPWILKASFTADIIANGTHVEDSYLNQTASVEEILDACAGLVSLNNDSNGLEFMHQTLMDYLIRKSRDILPRSYLQSAKYQIRYSYFDITSEIISDVLGLCTTVWSYLPPGDNQFHRSYHSTILHYVLWSVFWVIFIMSIRPIPWILYSHQICGRRRIPLRGLDLDLHLVLREDDIHALVGSIGPLLMLWTSTNWHQRLRAFLLLCFGFLPKLIIPISNFIHRGNDAKAMEIARYLQPHNLQVKKNL